MDSFLASAGNLDDLLDELEEEETQPPKKETRVASQESRKTKQKKKSSIKNTSYVKHTSTASTKSKTLKLEANNAQQLPTIVNPVSSIGNHPHEVTTSASINGSEIPVLPNLIDINDECTPINKPIITKQSGPSNIDLLLQIDDGPTPLHKVQPPILDFPIVPFTDLTSQESTVYRNTTIICDTNDVIPEHIAANNVPISDLSFANTPDGKRAPVSINNGIGDSSFGEQIAKVNSSVSDIPTLSQPVEEVSAASVLITNHKPQQEATKTEISLPQVKKSETDITKQNNEESIASAYDVKTLSLEVDEGYVEVENVSEVPSNSTAHVETKIAPWQGENKAIDREINRDEISNEEIQQPEIQKKRKDVPGPSVEEEGAVGFADIDIDISDSELNEFMESDAVMASILNSTSEATITDAESVDENLDSGILQTNFQSVDEVRRPPASGSEISQQTDNFQHDPSLERSYSAPTMSTSSSVDPEEAPEYSNQSSEVANQRSDINQGDMIDNIQVMPFETPEEVAPPQRHTRQSHAAEPTNSAPPTLGEQKPTWVPDSEAPNCSQCENKFTFTRRRHHCRACGKVFCSSCCYHKTTLKYMKSNKEERVCSMCYSLILHAAASTETAAAVQPPEAPSQDTPSTSSGAGSQPQPTDQPSVRSKTAPQTVPGPKSVRFADGTRPDRPQETPLTPPMPQRGPRHRKLKPHGPNTNAIPPVVVSKRNNKPYEVEENPDATYISAILSSEGPDALEFLLNQNLSVKVRFLMCGSRHCWCFWTNGMDCVGQNEMAILFEREGLGDVKLPNDVFTIFTQLFEQARRGKVVNNYDMVSASALGFDKDQSWCGSALNAGIIFVQPTYQFFCGFYLGDPTRDPNMEHKKYYSVLFGLLVHKSESPWAALVPKRLLLRLGAEFKQYPCPLFSVRERQSAFADIGHTILGILCDFTHYKYKVMTVPGINVIVSSTGKVSLHIPCNRFTDIIKIINSSSNESVFAVASGAIVPPKFNAIHNKEEEFEEDHQMDSHLVCIQNTSALNYRTEILGIKKVPPKHTGAVFIVFNGSLHSDEQNRIKATIIEDGVMVQLLPERMTELISSLKAMEDFEITNEGISTSTGSNNSAMHSVEIKWVKDDKSFNIGLFSPINFLSFEGILGFNVQGRSEQKGQKHIIRWNQVFFISNSGDTLDTSRLAEQIANSVFLALTPLLHDLVKNDQTKLSVRVTIHPDDVSYIAGSRGNPLPSSCMNSLDDELVATIHNAASNLQADSEPIVLELIFSVLNMRFYYHSASVDM